MEKVYVGIMLIAVAIAVLAIAVAIKERKAFCRENENAIRALTERDSARAACKTHCIELRGRKKQIAELSDACEKYADEALRLEEKREELMRENDRLSCILHGEVHTAFKRLPRDVEVTVIDERSFYVRDGDLRMIFEDGGYAGYFLGDIDERIKKLIEAPTGEVRSNEHL